MSVKKKLGLIVNPIAGIGGRVGLKGSDGHAIQRKAMEMGAEPEAPGRAAQALRNIAPMKEHIEVITYPYDMGEEELREYGFEARIIGRIKKGETSGEDTCKAAGEMERAGIDLLLFAGGDGTARDIYRAIGDRIPVLGIPTGVKMHSAVFATNPWKAGDLAGQFLDKTVTDIRITKAEVMDIDEASFRKNRLSAKLYGYLRIPYRPGMNQCPKAGDCAGERQALNEIATDVINNMEEDQLYIVGPGTTTKAVMEKLGLENSLLGVDTVFNGKSAGSDLNEARLLHLIQGKKAKIIVGIIGGQGYIFGRGNQQISSRIIHEVGREDILILATMEKIVSLKGAPLLVDTGDEKLDRDLRGYMPVIHGLGERVMLRVAS